MKCTTFKCFDIFYEDQLKIESEFCAVCRNSLSDLCGNCVVGGKDMFDLEIYLRDMKNIYLHAYWCLKPIFKKDIAKKIISFLPVETDVERECYIGQGDCGHQYHDHCIERWRKKRDNCPLDSGRWNEDLSNIISHVKIFPKL